MKLKVVVLMGRAMICFLAGCASKPVSLPPLGPEPGSHISSDSKGCLQVFSATIELHPEANSTTYFHPHSGYVIYDESGKVVRFVSNHLGAMDEWPDEVTLPAGHYTIAAASTCCGQVIVPVVIQKSKITVVHLDNNWRPAAKALTNQLVYLPNGEAVGWSSSTAKAAE